MKEKNKRISGLIGVMIVALFVLSLIPNTQISADEGTKAFGDTLTSKFVTTGPTVDGDASDTVWNDATGVTISVSGGANFAGPVDVTLKSVYTDSKIFFLAQWADAEDSYDRFPWVYNITNSEWEQLGDTGSHDENDYYEDKLGILWNVNNSIDEFTTIGCSVTCHSKKYTAAPDERGDMWHWKRVRTNPVGMLDDKYLNDDTNNGRKSDPKTGGGYSNNVQTLNYTDDPLGSTTIPKLYYPSGTFTGYILDSDNGTTAKFITDVYTNQTIKDIDGNWYEPDATTRIGGIIVSPFQGDRGDVTAKGVWSGGLWTLEISRDLETGSEFDNQFDDLADEYYFSLAAFNNAQVDHSTAGSTVYKLVFEDLTPPAAVSGLSATAGAGSVALSWGTTADAVKYKVYYGTSEITDVTASGVTYDGETTGITYTVDGLTDGTTYYFAVTAVDEAGNESPVGTGSTGSATPSAGEAASDNLIWYIIIVIIVVVIVLALVLMMRKKGPGPSEPKQKEE